MIFLLLSALQVYSELVYFVEVARHGARGPSNFMPWDQGRWPSGESALTPEGMRQHYLIGQYLRFRYITNNPFLSNTYNQSELLLVSSTKDRAYQSLQSQILGLYPNQTIPNRQFIKYPPLHVSENLSFNASQFIPAWAIVVNQIDPMLHSKDKCPDYDVYEKKRKNSKGNEKIIDKYAEEVKVVQERYNITEKEARKMIFKIIGSIRSNKFAGYDWDPVFDEKFVERSQELYMESKTFTGYSPDYVARFVGSDFWNDFIRQVEEVRNGQMKLKASIYSAHDTTLMSIFATLGMTLHIQPPFASIILLELHKENGNFFIQMLYNMQNIELPGCPNEKCPIEKFLNYISRRVFEDTDKACKGLLKLKEESYTISIVDEVPPDFIVINSAIVIAEIVLLLLVSYKKFISSSQN
ncbi:hypothetical protein SteCoe_33767 [Stentor coeruleus]|uniref:Acid phosphatase n=1 Tax=Stentor coeruleus TaxID=5963 RepID=A0A1R2AW05_9CILI|nr:hypothetical protein SteCoe_33767 [Stentor coeruleus]